MVNLPSIMEAQRDANEVIKKIRSRWSGPEFGTYSRLYHIATEDSHTYINDMGSDFTTTFTVGSSGDQGIECSSKGAKDVYFFDRNRVDKYFLSLRKVSLSTLKRKDFLDFMIAESSGEIMDYRLYQKVSPKLYASIRMFWDIIYQYFGYNHLYLGEELFRSTKKHAKMSRSVNGYYANNEIYYETQKKVSNASWHFIESDFYDLEENMPDGVSFNSIILSNIYEYLNFGFDTNVENAKKYINFIKKVLLPKLKDTGTCMGAYFCRYDENVDQYIGEMLKDKPNGWIPSGSIFAPNVNLDNLVHGYTSQNVAYYYLLQEMEKEFPIRKVKTRVGGYGLSKANNDLAIMIEKQKILVPQKEIIR